MRTRLRRVMGKNGDLLGTAVAPTAPTNFLAGDGVGEVTCTWDNSTIGNPEPTYDLYEAGALVASDITSPYVHTVVAGTRSYFVRAVNDAGTADSNADDGTST